MKMVVTFSSEAVIHVCQSTRRHFPEYRILTNRRLGSLKYDIKETSLATGSGKFDSVTGEFVVHRVALGMGFPSSISVLPSHYHTFSAAYSQLILF